MTSYHHEVGYINLLDNTLLNGYVKKTRNGFTHSVFGKMITFNNIDIRFPLLTTKKVFFKGVVEELLWFLSGSSNVKSLQKKGVHIWDGNSSREYLDKVSLNHYEEGEVGPIYGFQWRHFGKKYGSNDNGFDQIKFLLEELLKGDNSRRAVLSSWNPSQLKEMALPPCHILYSFYKDTNNNLSCLMNMRSSDLFLGLPFNIASTALLLHIIAKVLHMIPKDISIVITDAHIYEEHKEAFYKQRENPIYMSPYLEITKNAPLIDSTIEEKIEWIERLSYNDFKLSDYKSAGIISAPMK